VLRPAEQVLDFIGSSLRAALHPAQ
jgi:hypothetical protein